MKPVPRVRLIQSWQTYPKGAFLWPTGMNRAWLIATGRAVLDPEPQAETKSPAVTLASPTQARRPRTKKEVA